MIFGAVGPRYKWTANGRSTYRVQCSLLQGSDEGLSTITTGHDAIQHCANANWFEWLKGSAPLFWNWLRKFQKEVRDGQPHYLTGTFRAPYLKAQSRHKDPAKHKLMRAKVVNVRRQDYIGAGEWSATPVSSVLTKGPRTFG